MSDELLKKLYKVNLSEARVTVLDVTAMGSAYHKKDRRAIWWYNILDNRLEYSEIPTTHYDRKVFKSPFTGDKLWVRGQVFQHKERYYILVFLEDWLDHTVTNKSIADLYKQIQDKFKHMISDVIDWEGRTLAKNKKVSKDLDERYVAYDRAGKALGEVVYRKGVLVSRKTIKRGGHGKKK